ncbi:MAG: acetyl-CoA C-acyltransferase [Chloroflexi bacterium]|nr:acetyl-CoA C-acyltransferase [Chloroflexota bacterium]
MTTRRVVVVGAARSAIGKFGGSLKDTSTVDLGAHVVKEAVTRAAIESSAVEQVFIGNVIHTDMRDMYVARAITIHAGLSIETPALSLNRVCGSGLQAIISAAQAILLGDVDVAVAGGVESMSRAPYWLPTMRWGQRMQDGVVLDAMTGALTDPFDGCAMGMTAERVATRYGITREMQDQLALNSQLRAAAAIETGYFASQIAPIDIPTKGGTTSFAVDEGVRGESTLAGLTKLRPIFDAKGSVTAGNSSSINDGAAALVLMEEQVAQARGLPILAHLVGYSHVGVDPAYMGIGPVPAIQKVLAKTGIGRDDVAIYEVNEAFAAQAAAVTQELGLDPAKVNPNGSGISLGHPLGASGAIVSIKAIYELQRTQQQYAVTSLCIGGGQGIAAVWARA